MAIKDYCHAQGTGDHDFHVYKLNITSIFFLDFYGGSAPLTPKKYFAAKVHAFY